MRAAGAVPIWPRVMAYSLDVHPSLRPALEALPPSTLVSALQELATYAHACERLPVGPKRLARPARFHLHVERWRLTVTIDHALAQLTVVSLEGTPEPWTPPWERVSAWS